MYVHTSSGWHNSDRQLVVEYPATLSTASTEPFGVIIDGGNNPTTGRLLASRGMGKTA